MSNFSINRIAVPAHSQLDKINFDKNKNILRIALHQTYFQDTLCRSISKKYSAAIARFRSKGCKS